MRNPCIRSCLQWCVDQWKEDECIHGSWGNLRCGGNNTRRVEFLGTFSELWQRLHWHKRNKLCLVQDPIWKLNAESAMGITPSELLAITCLMMLNACPFIESTCRPKTHAPQSCQYIALRALEGGLTLSQKCDREIADAFLDASSWLNSPSDEGAADVSHTNLLHDYIRAFLPGNIQLQLPKLQCSRDNDRSQANTHFNASRPNSNLSVSPHLPTLASPLQSSDLESLRSLQERIRDRDKTMRLDWNAQLPSGAIHYDASLSSLGLLSTVLKDASSVKFSVGSREEDVRSI